MQTKSCNGCKYEDVVSEGFYRCQICSRHPNIKDKFVKNEPEIALLTEEVECLKYQLSVEKSIVESLQKELEKNSLLSVRNGL